MPIERKVSASSTKAPIGTPAGTPIGTRESVGAFRLSALWEAAIPDLSVLDDSPPDSLHRWRKEVIQGGRYWQWRTGRADSRKAVYGGTFRTLSDERKAQYERNRKPKRAQKKKRASIAIRVS